MENIVYINQSYVCPARLRTNPLRHFLYKK